MVTLTCPNCHFTAQISEDKIPAEAKWVKCPKCRQRFELADHSSTSSPDPIPIDTGSETVNGRHVSPWENRMELGILQSIFQTFRGVLFTPKVFFRTMTFHHGIKEPFAFGLLFGSLGYMFGIFWQFLLSSDKTPGYVQKLLAYIPFNFLFLGILILSPFIIMVMMFLTSAVFQLFLIIVKGSKHGFEGTFRVIAFSQTANFLGIIPIIGGFISTFWYFVILIIGLREIHETSYPRVFFAILMPLGLIFIIVMVALVASIFALF